MDNLYRFCLKIHGSARPADRPTPPRGQALRGSFGLPGANQNRLGAVRHSKPENSNQISIKRTRIKKETRPRLLQLQRQSPGNPEKADSSEKTRVSPPPHTRLKDGSPPSPRIRLKDESSPTSHTRLKDESSPTSHTRLKDRGYTTPRRRLKRAGFFLSALWIFLAFSFPTEGRVQVSAVVDKNRLPLNDSLTFTIQIEFQGKEPKNLILPDLSELQDFHVLSRWSGTSHSLSFVNGKMTRKKTLMRNYSLQPKTRGRLRLDPLNVQVGRKIFKTKAIFIEVTPEESSPPAPPAPGFPLTPFPRGFQNLFPAPFSSGKPLVKFQLFLNKKSAYLGEMVLADWVVFFSADRMRYQIEKAPTLKGFWREELVAPSLNMVSLGTEVIDNVLYKKELLNSYALFPVETGDLEIDSFSVRFVDLWNFSGKEILKTTAPRRFPVRPLPLEGRGNFSGAVGQFNVYAFLSKTEGQTGQPLSYKLRFEGRGAVRDIRPPKILFPSSVKIYPPAEKSEFSTKKSWKEFEYLLIPQKTGTFKVPAFPLTVFHPETGNYRTHNIPALSFKVTKGKGRPLTEGLSFLEGNDEGNSASGKWKPARETGALALDQRTLLKFWAFFYLTGAVGFLLIYFIRRRGWKKTSLKENLEKQFKKIQDLVKKGQAEQAAVSLINLICQTVSRLAGESSQEWRKMLEALPPSAREKFEEPLTRLIEELEALSFAPGNPSAGRTQQIQPLLRKTQSLLQKMVSHSSGGATEEDPS